MVLLTSCLCLRLTLPLSLSPRVHLLRLAAYAEGGHVVRCIPLLLGRVDQVTFRPNPVFLLPLTVGPNIRLWHRGQRVRRWQAFQPPHYLVVGHEAGEAVASRAASFVGALVAIRVRCQTFLVIAAARANVAAGREGGDSRRGHGTADRLVVVALHGGRRRLRLGVFLRFC